MCVCFRLQMSEPAKDLLRGMLERKVSDRLGSAGATDVRRAAFFQLLSFDRVLQKAYEPEFRPPAARSQTDVVNFDPEFTSEVAADSLVVSRMTQTMEDRSKFEGFTYQSDNRMKG